MAQPLLHIVLKNLSSMIEEEGGLILGMNKKMNKLASILTTIQALIEDAEQKQLESNPIRNWLIKLEDLTYEIDDILDKCATHVSKLKHKNSIPDRNRLKKILFRHKIGRRMKQVTEMLDAIAAVGANFLLRDMELERPSMVAATARETVSLLGETDPVHGREDEKEEIVDMLANRVKDNQEVSILPIIGVGGIGKTTLAQLVFKDPRVIEHFQTRLWVYVSEDFDVKVLVKAMIESMSGSASNFEHLDALERRLWYLLKHRGACLSWMMSGTAIRRSGQVKKCFVVWLKWLFNYCHHTPDERC